MTYIDQIENMGACPKAIAWLRKKNYKSLATAWRYCQRGDWMMWLAARTDLTEDRHKQLVLAACDCADLAKHLRKPEDAAALEDCVETARAWTEGEASLDEVRAAVHAVADSTYAGYAADYAVHAVADSTYARYATDDAVHAATATVHAVHTAALKKCADIVRKHLNCPRLGGEE